MTGVVASIDDYAAILGACRPLIDVRAPAEFARGALPGAVNLPLLDDHQRAAVGKTYKAAGRRAAVATGERLVGAAGRRSRVAAWRAFAAPRPEAAIYCWRGGLRSAIAQSWLGEAGVTRPRIAGGFKALRRFCLETIERGASRRFILIGGRTGGGKTRLLRAAAAHIDLEALGNHRGSAFGARATPQPPPVGFENALAVALLGLPADAPVAIEDEGRTIGRLAIPAALFEAMGRSPIAILEAPIERRIDNIYREYVLAAERPERRLPESLARIERRLGGARYRRIAALMAAAFAAPTPDQGRELHQQWIGRLLRDYYDPMYDYQLKAKADRIVARGDAAELRAYLETHR